MLSHPSSPDRNQRKHKPLLRSHNEKIKTRVQGAGRVPKLPRGQRGTAKVPPVAVSGYASERHHQTSTSGITTKDGRRRGRWDFKFTLVGFRSSAGPNMRCGQNVGVDKYGGNERRAVRCHAGAAGRFISHAAYAARGIVMH